jgi:hypothetical protein
MWKGWWHKMTNKEWLDTLNPFDKAVVLVNFVRNAPQAIQTDEEAIKREFRKWLNEEHNNS